MQVVTSWLDYRMRRGGGKESSPLDKIRPLRWTAEYTTRLLELIWVLERTYALAPKLDELLNQVTAGATFSGSELPQPSASERVSAFETKKAHRADGQGELALIEET